MAETKKEIVEMSRMGISIIIVGVGIENFDMMHELDSDDHVRDCSSNPSFLQQRMVPLREI
jgi:hypothetical protein